MACCAAAGAARQEVTRDFQKTAALGGGRSFRIEHSLGSVSIHTQAKGEVEIRASIKCSADNAAEAQRRCDQIKIVVEESSTGVWVRTEYPHEDLFGGHRNLSYSVNYDITMPETAPLEVRNRFGAVSVSNLHAAGTINNSNGQVSFSGGSGRQRIENSFGQVNVAGNGGDVTVVNANGQVDASDVTGALDIRDRFGAVRVTNAGKRAGEHRQFVRYGDGTRCPWGRDRAEPERTRGSYGGGRHGRLAHQLRDGAVLAGRQGPDGARVELLHYGGHGGRIGDRGNHLRCHRPARGEGRIAGHGRQQRHPPGGRRG
jgi:hypothetical protein